HGRAQQRKRCEPGAEEGPKSRGRRLERVHAQREPRRRGLGAQARLACRASFRARVGLGRSGSDPPARSGPTDGRVRQVDAMYRNACRRHRSGLTVTSASVRARGSRHIERGSMSEQELVIGMDVGSTTVKAVVIEPESKSILWHDYQRHHTKQPEKVLEFLRRILEAFPEHPPERFRMFLTGSGSGPLAAPTGGKFVQEVNAVTLAVEHKHPDVLSVIELGG